MRYSAELRDIEASTIDECRQKAVEIWRAISGDQDAELPSATEIDIKYTAGAVWFTATVYIRGKQQ